METTEQKLEAKMDLIRQSSELMPAGKPNFLDVIRYPKISDMIADHGYSRMLKVIFLMVKDFCASMNVVRNMNEDQMIEAAAMLLDECGNFRIEDYVMMFQLGKRGQLVKLMDRIDINVITLMLDEYWSERHSAALLTWDKEEVQNVSYGQVTRTTDGMHPQDARLSKSANNLAGAIGDLKNKFKEWNEDNEQHS